MRLTGKKAALASAAILFSISNSTLAGGLTGTLAQLVARWETGDPALSQLLAADLTSRSGEPVALVRLAERANAAQDLPDLYAGGLHVAALRTVDSRHVEGYS